MQNFEKNEMEHEVPAEYFSLNEICLMAGRGEHELEEMQFAEDGPIVAERIVVRLGYSANGKCCKCGRKLRAVKGSEETLVCVKCGHLHCVREPHTPRWAISEHGLAMFVARGIAKGWAQPAGDVFMLGEVGGRDIYFAIEPTIEFMTSHNECNISVIAARNKTAVPAEWKGSMVLVSELFYYHNGEFHVAPNIKRRIVPVPRKGLHRGINRIIHERREAWLQFIMHQFSKPYNPKDFYRGSIRSTVVRDWFKKNIIGAPANVKTYQRDYRQFRTYTGSPGEHDYREAYIVLLLKMAADPNLPNRETIVKNVSELLLRLKEEEKNAGHRVEISFKWQYCGEINGKRTPVAVASAPDPGELLDMKEAAES